MPAAFAGACALFPPRQMDYGKFRNGLDGQSFGRQGVRLQPDMPGHVEINHLIRTLESKVNFTHKV